MNLRELTQEQIKINYLLDESEGEITEEIAQMLEITESEEGSACDYFASVIADYKAEQEKFAKEIERLQSRKKVIGNKIENLKRYMLDYMLFNNRKSIEGEYNKASVRYSKVVNITDEDRLTREAREEVLDIMGRYPWVDVKVGVSKAFLKGMEALPDGAEIGESTSLIFR